MHKVTLSPTPVTKPGLNNTLCRHKQRWMKERHVNGMWTNYIEERAPSISVAPATQISMHVELATSKTKLICGPRCQRD